MVSESESLYLNLCLKCNNLWSVFAVFGFIFCCFNSFRPQSWADELESLKSNLTISLVESIFNAMIGACLAPVLEDIHAVFFSTARFQREHDNIGSHAGKGHGDAAPWMPNPAGGTNHAAER